MQFVLWQAPDLRGRRSLVEASPEPCAVKDTRIGSSPSQSIEGGPFPILLRDRTPEVIHFVMLLMERRDERCLWYRHLYYVDILRERIFLRGENQKDVEFASVVVTCFH